MHQIKKPLTLLVVNPEQLEAGITPQFTCSHSGAVIGSSRYADWWLKDSQMSIEERHCELIELDNYVCLRDLSGFTYINSASMPIGKGRVAKLQITMKSALDAIGLEQYWVVHILIKVRYRNWMVC